MKSDSKIGFIFLQKKDFLISSFFVLMLVLTGFVRFTLLILIKLLHQTQRSFQAFFHQIQFSACNHTVCKWFALIHWAGLAIEYETTQKSLLGCRQQHDCLPGFCLVQRHIHILFSVSDAWNIIWKMHISNPLIALSKHFAQELCYINSLKCLGQNIIWWRHSSGPCIFFF